MHRLLLLGTGGIAGNHVEEFGKVPACAIVACVDSAPGKARKFASAHDIPHHFESVDQAIEWNGFDAVINATPDGAHKATTMQMLAADKHVFCEKPLAPRHADALAMTAAAETAGVINMVNLSYRNSPALQHARRMVEAREIGDLRHVEAAYRQSWLVGKSWGDWRTMPQWLWRLSTEHGSTGVLGDVGIHIIDFASFGAADEFVSIRADLATFPKAAGDRIGDYRLDANDSVAMTGRLGRGALATIVATRFATGHLNDLSLSLHGTRGALKVETDGKTSRLTVCRGENVDKGRWVEVETPPVLRNAGRFVEALSTGVNGDPGFRRAAEIQKVIDAALASAARGARVEIGDAGRKSQAFEKPDIA